MTDDWQVLLVVSLGVTVPAYHRAYHSKETKHVFLQTYRDPLQSVYDLLSRPTHNLSIMLKVDPVETRAPLRSSYLIN